MPRNKLIIFDYSGTLSLNAVLFGRPSHLMKELKISGLAALGIDTPEIFWRDIVNPTWRVGSTTSLGINTSWKHHYGRCCTGRRQPFQRQRSGRPFPVLWIDTCTMVRLIHGGGPSCSR